MYITINTQKAMLKDNPYLEPELYKYYIRNTIGNYWSNTKEISLSYGQFAKELIRDKKTTIEQQTINTLVHEFIHKWLHKELNIKVCVAFDNIAPRLEEYGMW